MNQDVLPGALALLLLVVGLPLALSCSQRNRDERLAQPVIAFTSRNWQHKLLALLSLIGAVAGLAFVALGGTVLFSGIVVLLTNSSRPTADMLLLMSVGGLFLLTLGAIITSPAVLYWNYWRSLGPASLTFNQPEQTLEYTSRNGRTRAALTEVRQLRYYHTRHLRQNIGYTMLLLNDGRQLPVPTALCDFNDLRTLLPRPEVKTRACWLPVLPGKPGALPAP